VRGLAQINGARGETESVEEMERRIQHDLQYLRNWSVKLDLQIVWKTALMMLRGDPKAY
jgi:putative colanic acid biosynthesis UDP-glucose lipid carrier transferase